MIVSLDKIDAIVQWCLQQKHLALDTETTGLKWYDQNELFSIIIAGPKKQVFYFDFNIKHSPEALPRTYIQRLFQLFAKPDLTWFIHNAKFDLGMLAREGAQLAGTIHCTEAMARLVFSGHKSYSLANCLARMNRLMGRSGIEKSDKVKEYIQKNKLYTDIVIKGKKKPIREMHFEKVPLELIVPYAEIDALGTYELGQFQRQRLTEKIKVSPKLPELVHNERALTKVCHRMEFVGVPFDVKFNSECLGKEALFCSKKELEWKEATGREFKDSAKEFAQVFNSLGIKSPIKTETGQQSFAAAALERIDHPLAGMVLDWRASNKRVSTYHSTFTYYGSTGRIHAIARQAGTGTGRMSYAEPNLQNVPKKDEDDPHDEAAQVRRCFIPEKFECFFMPDYDQMEYRLMAELAGETRLIDKVNSGLDVHQATADLVGVSRKAAKTINFMLLYGGGAKKLAIALGISLEHAKQIKMKYFSQLPMIKRWIYQTVRGAEIRGHIINLAGRICVIPRDLAYKAPNYIIQGGCADIMKKAMVRIDSYIEENNLRDCIRMYIQIHDELLIGMKREALCHAPKIVEIMESVYPYKKLKLTAGPKYSWKSWGDPIEGYPEAA